jgi:hypothetical protein
MIYIMMSLLNRHRGLKISESRREILILDIFIQLLLIILRNTLFLDSLLMVLKLGIPLGLR